MQKAPLIAVLAMSGALLALKAPEVLKSYNQYVQANEKRQKIESTETYLRGIGEGDCQEVGNISTILKDPMVRRRGTYHDALHALGRTHCEEAYEILMTFLNEYDYPPGKRGVVAQEIVKFGDRGQRALDMLVRELKQEVLNGGDRRGTLNSVSYLVLSGASSGELRDYLSGSLSAQIREKPTRCDYSFYAKALRKLDPVAATYTAERLPEPELGEECLIDVRRILVGLDPWPHMP